MPLICVHIRYCFEQKKEVNINALFDKVINELEDHYKTKLISIANGSFDVK